MPLDGSDNGHERVSDAVVDVLHALNSLWEAWTRSRRLRRVSDQDSAVRGDAIGATVAALVFARGSEPHELIEFGEAFGYGIGTYGRGPYGAFGWCWQALVEAPPVRLAQRGAWYEEYLFGRRIVATIETATDWLTAQSALQT